MAHSKIREPQHSEKQEAHVHMVFRCERIWGIFEDENANDGEPSGKNWCPRRRCQAVAVHRLEGYTTAGQKTTDAYRKGC